LFVPCRGDVFGVYFATETAVSETAVSETAVSKTKGACHEILRPRTRARAKASARGAHYQLNDDFFRFWFRFIFKYGFLLEIKGYEKVREIIRRDYPVFSGIALERYFRGV
jgi:uncharacterized protein